jgi:hypothetical protein
MTKESPRKRGRPKSSHAMTGAERMRLMRARRRAQGYKTVSQWKQTLGACAPVWSSHRVLDARSLVMHTVAAAKIARDPRLIERAKRNLDRWKLDLGEEAPAWWREWNDILQTPWQEVVLVMTELSENAVRLRQSSPFAGVLTPDERRRVYEAFKS